MSDFIVKYTLYDFKIIWEKNNPQLLVYKIIYKYNLS